MPKGVYPRKNARSDESYLEEIAYLKKLREEVRASLRKLTRDINKRESALAWRKNKDKWKKKKEDECVGKD